MTPTEEIEYLKEKVRQLEARLANTVIFPLKFRLTRTEAGILRVIYRRRQASIDQLMVELYGNLPAPPGDQIINVFTCKLRKKLGPFGIEIKTLWGIGYAIDGPSKAKLREYIESDGAVA